MILKNDKLPNTLKYNGKNCGNIPKQLKLLNNLIALELRFTMENYGTMEKTMVLWNKIMVL